MEVAKKSETLGDLKNKPLVEAIFELGWSVSDPADQFWDVLPGLYYHQVRNDFPHIEKLPASQIPLPFAVNTVRHRFRKGADSWPLTQLGPGVLTVNDTASYTTWGQFLPRITDAVNSLIEVYGDAEPFNRAELRYINAVEFDPNQQSFVDFVKGKLHTSISLPKLFDGDTTTTDVVNANFTPQVRLKRPPGFGEIIVAHGQANAKPAVVFHINVRSRGENAPKNKEDIQRWADDAHRIIDAWFLSFCDGELLNSFKG